MSEFALDGKVAIKKGRLIKKKSIAMYEEIVDEGINLGMILRYWLSDILFEENQSRKLMFKEIIWPKARQKATGLKLTGNIYTYKIEDDILTAWMPISEKAFGKGLQKNTVVYKVFDNRIERLGTLEYFDEIAKPGKLLRSFEDTMYKKR
ncbi:MAG: hypothetical protein FWG51_04485 [Firmicutes bacterium]|nr:hypothetical protein [Bacillota bacterium]